MFFLIIAVLETICTVTLGLIAILSDKFYIGGIAFFSFSINCVFWFSLYSMWKRAKKAEKDLIILRNSLNQCRKKLNLPKLEEEKKEEKPDALPIYNPFFNPYAEENGIDIDDYIDNETDDD